MSRDTYADAGRIEEYWSAELSLDPDGLEEGAAFVSGWTRTYGDATAEVPGTYNRNVRVADSFRYTIPARDWLCEGTDPTCDVDARIATRTAFSVPDEQETVELRDYDPWGNARTIDILHPRGTQQARIVVDYSHELRTGDLELLDLPPPGEFQARWLRSLPLRVRACACVGQNCLGPEPNPRTLIYGWNLQGTLDFSIREPNAELNDPEHVYLRTDFTRNLFGQITRMTESESFGASRSSSIGYDADFVQVRSMRNAAGHLSYFGLHPALGAPLVTVDPNGITTRMRFDGFGRPLETIEAAGGGGTLEWDTTSVAVHDNGGADATSTLDRLGRVIASTGESFGGSIESSRTFDRLGHLLREDLPSSGVGVDAAVEWVRDSTGRPWRMQIESAPGEGAHDVARWSWSTPRRITTRDERDGASTVTSSFDGLFESSSDETVGGSVPVSATYGPFSELSSMTAGSASETVVISRDTIGRPTTIDDPDAGVRIRVYNAWGEIIEEAAPGALRTQYVRDVLGRVTERRIDYGEGGEIVRTEITGYVFDTAPSGVGMLDYVTSAEGHTTQHRYDALSRLRGITQTFEDGLELAVDYTYDSRDRLSSVTYPTVNGARMRVNYRYDNRSGQLTRIQSTDGRVDWRLLSEDGVGRPLSERAGINRVERDYDPDFGTLTGLRVRAGPGAGSPLLHDLLVSLEPDGMLETRVETVSGRQELAEHDRLDRVTRWAVSEPDQEVRDVTYEYGPTGNIARVIETGSSTTTEDYSYAGVSSGPHAVSTIVSGSQTNTVSYDSLGRVVSVGARTLSWTGFDLPRSVTTDEGVNTFEYDGFDRRALLRRETGETSHYLGELYERRSRPFERSQHVLHVMGPQGLLAEVVLSDDTSVSETLYLHADHLGTPQVITNAAGAVESVQTFDPFGARTSAAPSTQRGFTGHRQEDALGLIDMRGRYYDPSVRRFLTPDPVVAAPTSSQGWNRYSYVRNAGLNATDPTGFWDRCHGIDTGTVCVSGPDSTPPPVPDGVLEPGALVGDGPAPGGGLTGDAGSGAGDGAVSPESASDSTVEPAPQAPALTASAFFEAIEANATLDHAMALIHGFGDRLLSTAGLTDYVIGALLTLALESPGLNLLVGGWLVYGVYDYVSSHWEEITESVGDLLTRVVTGTTTDEDWRTVGEVMAAVVAFMRGSARGSGLSATLRALGRRGAAAAVFPRHVPAAPAAGGLRASLLNRLFLSRIAGTPATRSAEALLRWRAGTLEIPTGLTRDMLEQYRVVARGAIDDAVARFGATSRQADYARAVQGPRIELIDELLASGRF